MFYNKKTKAYSLLEFLIVLFVIGLIVILTTNMLSKNQKKSFKKASHGFYACTVFDDQEYVFSSPSKNIDLPLTKSGWLKGKCGQGFVMPDSGVMSVKLMGGGGAGGDAGIEWEDAISPQFFFESGSYSIPQSGYYDIVVSGAEGGESSVSSWLLSNGNQCFAENSKAGEPVFYQGTRYLSRNSLINIIYENAMPVSLNLGCTSQIKTPDGQPGRSGRDIMITSDGSKILFVEGSKSGTYQCNSTELCSNHFQPTNGEKGKVSTYSSFINAQQKYNYRVYEPGTVVLKWSDYNNTSKSFKAIKGCGGTTGEIKSALYPILKNTLPAIEIGKGGKSGTEPTATTFGSLKAEPGANNKICSTDNSNFNGVDGVSFTVLQKLNSKGGKGGISTPSDQINGSPATGFVSGGGGGAIYYNTPPQYNNSKSAEENKKPILDGVRRWYQGVGGNGGSGLLMITW